MKVAVVFVRVVGKPFYEPPSLRWLKSYQDHKAGADHRVVIINRYADSQDTLFDCVTDEYVRYDGGGWDCGSWQFAAKTLRDDLLVCCNSNTQITGDNWLARIVDAVQQHGTGLYGTMASNEVAPHIRTPCMIFHPQAICDYPCEVNERIDTWRFESMGFPNGTPNVTLWCQQQGYSVRLITWDGCWSPLEWRRPPNIFRKGNQSNIIIRDHHCEAYEASDDENKAMLQRMANG